MRPAGLIPSFSLIGLRSPAPSTRKGRVPEPLSRSCSAFGSLRSRTRRLAMRAYHRPEDCSPRSLLSRRLAASPAETLRQRLHGRVHSPPTSLADYSSARFACPPSRENLRAGFPCALGHPWLVTLAPANWGPVFFRTRDVRHRGYEEYAGRRFCLEKKLCTSCVNALEIEETMPASTGQAAGVRCWRQRFAYTAG
jgi:hypothetical protein